jgi:hypothetical protein
MVIKLGLDGYIDGHFVGWNRIDPLTKAKFFESDLEIYSKQKYHTTVDYSGKFTVAMVARLETELFHNTNQTKEESKNNYREFLDRICKPLKKASPSQENIIDKFSINSDINQFDDWDHDKEKNKLEEDKKLEYRKSQFVGISHNAKLSTAEISAFHNIIKKKSESNMDLSFFSSSGITQLANRATYKMIYTRQMNERAYSYPDELS